eukprot:TRINITY_DN2145_c0_g2_i1.p3 TRINITY_DN2145_c0_g2~~TRINITY_DN2145_c0_g2_i1.p3  ORF type:complete len:260 (+),score=19.98 TRINITY_DN2145_c0_g2_i1:71-781(+)
MYKIGITGGIASGKTTLSKYLSKYKYVRCLNLDQSVHKLYDTDYHLRQALATRFGPEILTLRPTGTHTINRQELSRIVFSNSDDLRSLNGIVHPCVFKYMNCEFEHMSQLPKDLRPDVVFIEGAVIIEAGWNKYFDEMWVTTLPKEKALERLLKRNKNIPKEQAEKRINMQTSDEERIKHAKFWYETMKPFKENEELIKKELERLKSEGKLRDVAMIQKIIAEYECVNWQDAVHSL